MWDQLIKLGVVVLGSSVISAVVTKIWDLRIEKRQEEQDREDELYGSLRFRLSYLDSLEKHRKDFFKISGERLKELSRIADPVAQQSFISQHFSNQAQAINIFTTSWWSQVEQIRTLLEVHAGKIKKEHFELVRRFLHGYIGREYVGKEKFNDFALPILGEKTDPISEEIMTAIDQLKDAIL